MKPEHEPFYKAIINSLQTNSLALFAGAGLSMPAGFVDWKGLLRDLANEIGINIDKENNLLAIAQEYVHFVGGRGSVNQTIMNEFTRKVELTENHMIIARLNIGTFWTTNFDTLLEESLRKTSRRPDVKHTVSQLSLTLPYNDVIVYKMHGDVSIPHETILTKQDFENYFEHRAAFLNILIAQLITKTFVFIGISFNDPNIMYVLDKVYELLESGQRRHWYFIKKLTKGETQTAEEFNEQHSLQQGFIEKLKTFSLMPVWIDDYTEITSILQELEDILIEKELSDINSYANNFYEYSKHLSDLQKKYAHNTNLLHFCALYYNENNQHEIERRILERILEIEPTNALIINHLGAVLHNYFKDYKAAEVLFYRALGIDPQFDSAHVNMGTNFSKLQDFKQAQRHYLKALEIREDNDSAYAGLGHASTSLGEFEEARGYLDKAILLNPKDSISYYNRAVLHHIHLRNYQQARLDYEKALALTPGMIDANLGYGMLLLNEFNDPLGGRTHYEIALKIDQNYYKAHYFIGLALEKNNIDPIGAHLKFKIASELNPDFTEIHFHLGIAFSRAEIWEEAKKCFEKSVELDAGDTIALFNLGTIYFVQFRDYENASSFYKRAINAGLRTPDVYHNLAYLYTYYLNDRIRAREVCDTLINILGMDYPNDKDALATIYQQRAIIEMEEPNYVSARNWLEGLVELNLDNSEAYEMLAAALNNGWQDYSYAKLMAEKGLSISPNSSSGLFNYSVILNNLNKHEEALHAVNAAIEIDPGKADFYWQKGNIQLNMEEIDEAKATFEQGLLIAPSHIDMLNSLMEILKSNEHYFFEALDRMEDFLSIHSDVEGAYLKYATLLLEMPVLILERDIERTMLFIEIGIKYHRALFTRALNLIADEFHKKGLLYQAILYQEKALKYPTENDSMNADTHEKIAILLNESDPINPLIIDYLLKAIAIYPHSYTLYNLGVTFENMGYYKKSRRCHYLASKLDPEYMKAMDALEN
jgi:tetratricopeptide (TPR) repeat protein